MLMRHFKGRCKYDIIISAVVYNSDIIFSLGYFGDYITRILYIILIYILMYYIGLGIDLKLELKRNAEPINMKNLSRTRTM